MDYVYIDLVAQANKTQKPYEPVKLYEQVLHELF